MTNKLVVQEEPAIYKVLRGQSGDAGQRPKVGKLREFVLPRREKVHPQDALHLPYVGMEQVEAHTMRLLGTVEASSMKSSANRFFPGDVLYGRLRPYLNKVYLATFEGICSPEFIVMPRTAGLDPQFLRYRLNAHDFVTFASHLNAGDRPRVDFEQVSEFTVALPPEDQQAQTVAHLDEQLSRLDASVAALRRVQANLKRYRASVLKSACEGRLVPTEAELARQEGRNFETGAQLLQRILAERRARQSERKYKDPTSPAVSELPELPAGWHWATMPQLGELNRGKSKHRPRDDDQLYGGPHPFIQTGDVRHADSILSRHTQTYSEFGLAQSRLWPAGTLCITIAANIAETARLSYPACFPDSIVGFVCDAGEAMTKWVQMFLATAREHLETFAPGTAQKNINLEVLQNVAIPLPSLTEQHRIVAEADRRLSLIRVAEAQVSANLARAQRLRQSILQAAFRTPAQAGQ